VGEGNDAIRLNYAHGVFRLAFCLNKFAYVKEFFNRE
jgi:hypothetical protein